MMDLKNEIFKYVVGIGPSITMKFTYVLYTFHINLLVCTVLCCLLVFLLPPIVLAVKKFSVYNMSTLRNVLGILEYLIIISN